MSNLENAVFTLKTARDLRGLTLTEASRQLGISPALLSKYERAEAFPRVNMLPVFEKVYNIPSDRIIFPSKERYRECQLQLKIQ